jgi:hypothetical protein|tara:strand:- start:1982 stop:2371 length:390 start_codon:yes stop_codon:yes gene_type:complete
MTKAPRDWYWDRTGSVEKALDSVQDALDKLGDAARDIKTCENEVAFEIAKLCQEETYCYLWVDATSDKDPTLLLKFSIHLPGLLETDNDCNNVIEKDFGGLFQDMEKSEKPDAIVLLRKIADDLEKQVL